MLFRLMLYRIGPLMVLSFLKDRRCLKRAVYGSLLVWGIAFTLVVLKIFSQEKWKSVVVLLFSMLPHYLFYGFSVWMLVRCIKNVWSERVWRRIYAIAFVCVLCGILTEIYINPRMIAFFVEKF